jgi:chromosome segregation ATPase
MKKIEELTLDEATSKIAEINVKIKLLSASIAGEKVVLAKLKAERVSLREDKRRAITAIQDRINKEKNSTSKERLRNQKTRDSKSWDNRIASKDKEINRIQEKLATLQKSKADGQLLISLIKVHIKNLKK